MVWWSRRVEGAAEAEAVVDRMRYPPLGSRGLAARRASAYGLRPRETESRCIVQIESAAGAAEAERIAAVEGVEALVVGCADLAIEAGERVNADASRLCDAIARVRDASETTGVVFGLAGPEDQQALTELAPSMPDLAVLGADVRIYARALAERFDTTRREAHVGA